MFSGIVRCCSWVRYLRSGRSMRRLAVLTAGLAFQTTTGGCEQALSDLAGALGNPVASGIGTGLSNLTQVLVLSLFI